MTDREVQRGILGLKMLGFGLLGMLAAGVAFGLWQGEPLSVVLGQVVLELLVFWLGVLLALRVWDPDDELGEDKDTEKHE